MKKTMKTREAVALHTLLNEASLAAMKTGREKYAIIKALRTLKQVAKPFQEFRDLAAQRLAAPDHEAHARRELEWREQLRRWEEQGREGEQPTLPEDTQDYIRRFTGELNALLEEEGDKEVTVDLPPLDEDAMVALLDGNAWEVGQAAFVDEWMADNSMEP